MRVIFMGTPAFAVPTLRALVTAGHEVLLAVTQPPRSAGRGRKVQDSAVADAAAALRIPVFQPERIREPSALAILQDLEPEVIVVASYGQILPRALLQIPAHGCVNVHPSLLPRYRGAAPISAALLAGDNKTGVSIMLMDPGMDTGPVLRQTDVPVGPEHDQVSLAEQLADIGAELLVQTLPDWVGGRITPVVQDNAAATTTRLVARVDSELDWSQTAHRLWCQVRAYAEWPQAFTHWNGRLLRIRAAQTTAEASAPPGLVLPWGPPTRVPTSAAVGTSSGLLVLTTLGVEGRRLLPVAEFLRGNPHFIGATLSAPPSTSAATDSGI